MHFLLLIIVLAFVIGLLSRNQGEDILDTTSKGCNSIAGCITLIVIAVILLSIFSQI
jgi:hypothetical protein